jgi:hypothetical protein
VSLFEPLSVAPGGFACTAAEPPWRFASNGDAKPGRNVRRHYRTLTLAEIEAKPRQGCITINDVPVARPSEVRPPPTFSHPPPSVRRVIAFADSDEFQQSVASANDARRRWQVEGRTVRVVQAAREGEYANDVWRTRAGNG